MALRQIHHLGVVVDDLPAAVAFFVELGMELEGEGSVEGDWVDRAVGVEGVRSDLAMLQAPGGGARIELAKFNAPSPGPGTPEEPANVPGLRHIAFEVDDLERAPSPASSITGPSSSARSRTTATSTGSVTSAAPPG